MFDQLKKIKQLKDLQSELKNDKEESEKDGVKIVMNGKMEIELVQINSELSKEENERLLKECVNNAHKNITMRVMQKMSSRGIGL